MSDEQIERRKEQVRKSLIHTEKGELDWQRIFSVFFAIWGGILLTIGQLQGINTWLAVLPGSIMLLCSLLSIGTITIRNIKDILSRKSDIKTKE